MGLSLFPTLSNVLALFGALAWPIIIVGVVILIVYYSNRNSKKARNNAVGETVAVAESSSNSSEPATENTNNVAPPRKEPKPLSPYTGINVMLLVGSGLLVAAIISFTHNADDRLVAPVAIFLTLLFYILGVIIYKTIDYLKIVGQAFTYISLAIFPFWTISFNFFGMSWHGAWALASVVTLIALISTAFIYKAKAPAYISYVWLFVVALSLAPESKMSGDVFNATIYWDCIACSIVAMIPAIIWKIKPKWMPIFFRKATQTFGMVFMPLVAAFTLFLFFVSNPIVTFPFLRTIVIGFLLAWAYIYWSITKSYSMFLFGRFVVQALLLTIAMDAFNYSFIFDSYVPDATKLGMVTIWLISFLGQTMISLFIQKKDSTAARLEHNAEIISLIGIFSTPILTSGFSAQVGATIRLIVYMIVAILGVSYAIVHRSHRWIIATVIALMVIRFVLSDILIAGWNSWSDIVYFSVVTGLVLVFYQLFRKYDETESLFFTVVETIILLFAIVASSINVDYAEIGWLISAIYLALLGFISNQPFLYEISIYSGALCLFGLTGTIGELVLPDSAAKCVSYNSFSNMDYCTGRSDLASYQNWIAGINVIRAFIIGGALTVVSMFKERQLEAKKRVRFLLSYIIMSIGLYAVGVSAGEYWMLFCLAVQIGYLVYAAIHDIEWLVWTTIFAMPLCALSLTGGFNYIWFAVLGLTLICIVVWRLSKINKSKIEAAANKSAKA